MSKLRPLGDRIVLRREKPPEKTAGGILYVPDAAKEKPLEAVVIETGPGKFVGTQFVEVSVKRNDRVLVGKYSGNEIMIDGVEHLVVREDDIVGVLE